MKALRVWIVLALVFCAGFAGGVVTTRVVLRRAIVKAVAQPDLVRMRIERDLFRTLQLNPRQRQQVHEILQDSHERMRTLRREFQPQLAAVARDTRERISAILDLDQQKSFERMQAENHPFFPAR